MRERPTFVVVLFILAATASADSRHAPDRELLAAARDRIERAYYAFNASDIERQIEYLEGLPTGAGWYGRYYRAILCAQLSGRYLRDDKDRADDLLASAQRLLEDALEEREHADLHALLGSVLGRRIAVSPIRAIWMGPSSVRHQERAVDMDSSNPRAVLELARSKMYRPSAVGGSTEEARALLLRSVELYQSFEEPDSLMADWGGPAEAYAFLALLERDEGHNGRAQRYAEMALALQPDYALVREEILPSLQGAVDADPPAPGE